MTDELRYWHVTGVITSASAYDKVWGQRLFAVLGDRRGGQYWCCGMGHVAEDRARSCGFELAKIMNVSDDSIRWGLCEYIQGQI